jgi:hypothetical protein
MTSVWCHQRASRQGIPENGYFSTAVWYYITERSFKPFLVVSLHIHNTFATTHTGFHNHNIPLLHNQTQTTTIALPSYITCQQDASYVSSRSFDDWGKEVGSGGGTQSYRSSDASFQCE